MKIVKMRVLALIICSLLVSDLAVSLERKGKRRNKWCVWPFCGQDNSSPNAELYRRLAMGVLQVMYNTQDNNLHKCIPLAGEWGKQLDPYKQDIDYWPTKVGPLMDIIMRFGGEFLLNTICRFRQQVLNFIEPWFSRRKVFLEGKFSFERKRFRRVFRKSKILF